MNILNALAAEPPSDRNHDVRDLVFEGMGLV